MTPKTLASPITMRASFPPRGVTSAQEQSKGRESGFVQYGHPYMKFDRFFVGLEPQWSGINAIEFTENAPVTYVKKLSTDDVDAVVDRLAATGHPNLVNLQEAFVTVDSFYFVYERWGISLKEIGQLGPVFKLGEVEVATLCNEILTGLRYIHDELNICHGSLGPEHIFIMENGGVKIGNIGESMIRAPNPKGKSQDLQDVCSLVRGLLGTDRAEGAGGTMRLLAGDFAGAPCTATIKELLQHPFLKFKTGSWCLRPINILCTIAQRGPGQSGGRRP